jgi:hypothetical protein
MPNTATAVDFQITVRVGQNEPQTLKVPKGTTVLDIVKNYGEELELDTSDMERQALSNNEPIDINTPLDGKTEVEIVQKAGDKG